jgi:hypothetical protein
MRANHTLHLTRRERHGCNHCVPCAGSLSSLGSIEHHMTIMKSRIIRFAWACVLSSAFVGCSNSTPKTVVVADADHQILPGSGRPQTPYEIPAASGIQLDIGQLQGATVKPDTVQFFDGMKHLYRLAQPINGNVILLDASTLNATIGPAFEGFKSGHHYVLHVGRAKPGNHPPGDDDMTDDWVALIIVK